MDPVTPTPPAVTDEDFGLTDEDIEQEETSEDTEGDAPVEAPAPAVQAETPAPASPEAADQSTAPAPASPPATPASPASDTAPQPFRFRADGTELPIDGVTKLANGDLVIPATALGQMQHFLGNRQQWREAEQGYRREIDRLSKATDLSTNPDVQRSRSFWDKVIGFAQQDQQDGGQRLASFIEDALRQLPVIDAEAKAAAAEAKAKALEEGYRPYQEREQAAQREPQDRALLNEALQTVLTRDPALAGMDTAAVAQTLWTLRDRGLFRVANEQEVQAGYAPGTRVIDPALFWFAVDQEKRVLEQRKQASQAQAIQAKNTKALAPAPIPPAPSTKASAPVGEGRKKPTTKEEWDRRLESFLEEPAL